MEKTARFVQEIEEILTPEQAQRFRQRLDSLRARLLPASEAAGNF